MGNALETEKLNETYQQLLEGFNKNVEKTEKIWIAFAVLCIYSIAAIYAYLPDATDSAKIAADRIKLPIINDLVVPRAWFLLIAASLITAMVASWAEATSRASWIRRRLVGQEISNELRRQWDAQVSISSDSVWGMYTILTPEKVKNWMQVFSTILLVILKLVSATVHYGLPALTLLLLKHSFQELSVDSWMTWIFPLIMYSGLVFIAIGFISAAIYSARAIQRAWET